MIIFSDDLGKLCFNRWIYYIFIILNWKMKEIKVIFIALMLAIQCFAATAQDAADELDKYGKYN